MEFTSPLPRNALIQNIQKRDAQQNAVAAPGPSQKPDAQGQAVPSAKPVETPPQFTITPEALGVLLSQGSRAAGYPNGAAFQASTEVPIFENQSAADEANRVNKGWRFWGPTLGVVAGATAITAGLAKKIPQVHLLSDSIISNLMGAERAAKPKMQLLNAGLGSAFLAFLIGSNGGRFLQNNGVDMLNNLDGLQSRQQLLANNPVAAQQNAREIEKQKEVFDKEIVKSNGFASGLKNGLAWAAFHAGIVLLCTMGALQSGRLKFKDLAIGYAVPFTLGLGYAGLIGQLTQNQWKAFQEKYMK